MSYSQTEIGRFTSAGGDILLVVDVSPDAATGDITISDVDRAYVLGAVSLIEDPAANAQVAVQAKENASTTNQIDIKLWQASNSAAATNFKDFRLFLLLKDAAI